MATTFNIIFLGKAPSIDPTEGNYIAENASVLVNMTFGSTTEPLSNNVMEMSPDGSGYAGGDRNAYEQSNYWTNDQFRTDDGVLHTHDATVVYSTVATFADGTTLNYTAVLFQDTDGNVFLAPPSVPDPIPIEFTTKELVSLTPTSAVGVSNRGLNVDRMVVDYYQAPEAAPACFVKGTRILTVQGYRPVEHLRAGDVLATGDGGRARIRCMLNSVVAAQGKLRPIRIARNALGPGFPDHALLVSRQHRMLLRSRVAERMFGTFEILVPACRLTELPGVEEVDVGDTVSYWHILCDRHEIILANGSPTETLYLGRMARNGLGHAARCEIAEVFPETFCRERVAEFARPCPPGKQVGKMLRRITKNHRALVEV